MVSFLSWLGGKLKAVLGLILPIYQKARGSGGMPGWLRTLLHVLVVLAILFGLHQLNRLQAIIELLPIRRVLAENWLPILFLLVYALCWLTYWLWTLLVSDEYGPNFPDIEDAWQEARTALRQAGLSLTDLPLFLILGQPEDDEKALFQAAQLTLIVKQTPASPDAPLHVYATREAIYLTCAGASLLGRLARFLAGKLLDQPAPGHAHAPSEEDEILTNTISPGARGGMHPTQGAVADMAKVFHQAEREGRPLNKAEKRELRFINRQSQPQRSPLKDPDLIAYQAARLHYLCRLLVRDRHPFCAVNGVLLLVPFAGCDSDQDAIYTAEALQRDLAVTGSALRVDCPHFALVCDLETAYGFTEFLQRFTPKERFRRLGQSCPLTPDLQASFRTSGKDGGVAKMLDSLARWLCQSVVPAWVYRKFQMEKADAKDRAELVRINGRLFLLADELQERSKRLSTILSRGLAPKAASGPLLFGGCYLAGTGSDAEREQAFVRGLMDRLSEGQSCVYWTRQTVAEEASYLRWSNLGWTVLAIVVVALLAFVGYVYFGQSSSFS